jgi:outer membrane protein TolC
MPPSDLLSMPRIRVRLAAAFLAGMLCAGGAMGQIFDPRLVGTMPEDVVPGLKPLLAKALTQNPRLLSQQLQIAVSRAVELAEGLGPMLPQLGGNAQYGTTTNSIAGSTGGGQSQKGLQYNFAISQQVFRWGELKNQLAIRKIGTAMEERQYAMAYRDLAATLRQQYLSLILEKLAIRNAAFTLKNDHTDLQRLRDALKEGRAKQGDLDVPELQENQAEVAYEQAVRNYDFGRHQVAREVGEKDLPDSAIPDDIPPAKFNDDTAGHLLAGFLSSGAANTLDNQMTEEDIRRLKKNYAVDKVRLLPKVFLSASVQQQNITNANKAVYNADGTLAAGPSVVTTAVFQDTYYLNVGWNIFDGFETKGYKQADLNRRRSDERKLEADAEDAMAQAQGSKRDLELAWEALRITEHYHDLTRSSYDLTEEAYKAGRATEAQIRERQGAIYNSESGLYDARAHFDLAWSSYVALVGDDPALTALPASYVQPVR